MKYVSCLFVLVLIACGNKVPRYTQKEFKTCFSGEANLSALIETKGYWSATGLQQPCLLFYDNGGFTINDCNGGVERFKEIIEDPKGNGGKDFYRKHWGACRISGDTLKCSHISYKSPSHDYAVYEDVYVVVNRSEVTMISREHAALINFPEPGFKTLTDGMPPVTFRFIPTSVQPAFDPWLFREKWFFCDGAARKKYRKK